MLCGGAQHEVSILFVFDLIPILARKRVRSKKKLAENVGSTTLDPQTTVPTPHQALIIIPVLIIAAHFQSRFFYTATTAHIFAAIAAAITA